MPINQLGSIMEISSHKEILILAEALFARGENERADDLVLHTAKFNIGDEVRWHESASTPENKCVVEDVKVVGWPEWDPTDAKAFGLVYELDCPGPMGVGSESYDVPEHDLEFYDEDENICLQIEKVDCLHCGRPHNPLSECKECGSA
jgi:hypothetical protein